jgi:DegV family protein with EDD domain
MAIRYLDGRRLQKSFIAAANWVNAHRESLNSINVFPVPDGDAGTNMAMTLAYAVDGIAHLEHPSLDDIRNELGRAVLVGARGNSGFILAQFTRGFLESFDSGVRRLHQEEVARACRQAFKRTYDAIVDPVEGTILTVMREWSNAVTNLSREPRDIGDILDGALERAKVALGQTQEQMALLKQHGVVDAGAQGFVHMLEGINEFIHRGALHPARSEPIKASPVVLMERSDAPAPITFRYCTQALVENPDSDPDTLKKQLEELGDSLIVGGDSDLLKVHIHSNSPDEIFTLLESVGTLLDARAEDMQKQADAISSREIQIRSRSEKQSVVIVADSTCDLSLDMAAEAGITVVPCLIAFGDEVYRDKMELTTSQFYEMLRTHPLHPTTSQPAPGDLEDVYERALSAYEKVLSIHISGKLSGTFQAAVSAAAEIDADRITVFDTETVTVPIGTMALQLSRLARKGVGLEELVHRLEEMRRHSKLYCVLETLEFLIKGGRVSKLRGWVGQILGLMPLITIRDGLLEAVDKVRNSRSGLEEILGRFADEIPEGVPVIGVVAHSNNPEMLKMAREEFEQRHHPVEMLEMEIGPAVGAHAGPGAWGIFYLTAPDY